MKGFSHNLLDIEILQTVYEYSYYSLNKDNIVESITDIILPNQIFGKFAQNSVHSTSKKTRKFDYADWCSFQPHVEIRPNNNPRTSSNLSRKALHW